MNFSQSASFWKNRKDYSHCCRVVDLVSDSGIPVIAAGGIVDGRGYVAALALGARGVCLGTRYSLGLSCFHTGIYQNGAFTL